MITGKVIPGDVFGAGLNGGSGIRTRGTREGTPDFESGTFGRSVIPPRAKMAKGRHSVKHSSSCP
jgi:hypothetical protein